MQLKRLFSTILVVILVMMAAVLTATADDSENVFEFSVALDATENSDGKLSLDSGDQLDVSLTIEKNPGTKYIAFEIHYDADALELVKDANGDVVFETAIFDFVYEYGATPKSLVNFDTPGVIKVMNDPLAAFNSKNPVKDLGEFLSFSFKAVADYHGEVEVKVVDATTSVDLVTVANGAKVEFHDFADTKTETVAPTCTEAGYDALPCTKCDFVQHTNQVDALGHKEVNVNAVPPTCTTDGATAGKQCTVCEEYTVAPVKVPATGHNAIVVPKVDATCTEDGHEAGTICSVCKEAITGAAKIKATGHDVEEIAGKEANCTVDGYTASKVCKTCDEVIEKANVIRASGHTTILTDGKAATCTEDGYTSSATCGVCKAELVKSETIKATGHTVEVIPAVEATADRSGSTAGEKCSVCQTVIKAPEVIPATGAQTTDVVDNPSDNEGGSLVWLWIVLAVVVVAGAGVAVYFFVIKKKA